MEAFTLGLHSPGRDAFPVGFDEEQADAVEALLAGSDGDGEVVRLAPAGDPLLLSVNDVMVSLPHSGGSDVRHVASCPRLAHSEGHDSITLNHRPADVNANEATTNKSSRKWSCQMWSNGAAILIAYGWIVGERAEGRTWQSCE